MLQIFAPLKQVVFQRKLRPLCEFVKDSLAKSDKTAKVAATCSELADISSEDAVTSSICMETFCISSRMQTPCHAGRHEQPQCEHLMQVN
jgi:hypothetical protein